MADSTDSARPDSSGSPPSGGNAPLERGTYEIIQSRLQTHADDLRNRLAQLNQLRRDVFGSIPTELTGTERISTANNCVPRDIVAVGDRLLFGYNVHVGLRAETRLEDVFSSYVEQDGHFREQAIDWLRIGSFAIDFQQLYKYYKDTIFHKFQVNGPFLYLVFKVGRSEGDIKTFKFLIEGDQLKYIDNRSDHEVQFPTQHGFEWTRTHRDLHRGGQHPHISIEDRIFVETIGGDLTVKIEDNTDDGLGIYQEPVNDPDQRLDDAEIFYAVVGNLILLKIRPFKEDAYRYLVYSEKTQQVVRLDAMAQACVLLPEDHGLIFARGFFLQSGDFKLFENIEGDLKFEKTIPSPNGEDYLYVFYHPRTGRYVLLSYNMIEQQVQMPLSCHGFSFFDDGRMICFRGPETPQKHHALQVWQTPFVGPDVVTATQSDAYLFRIGNREVVRAMAECHELAHLIGKDDTYQDLYGDLVRKADDLLDSYFWLTETGTFQLSLPIVAIRDAARAAVDEFDKVVRVRRNTRKQLEAAGEQVRQVIADSQVRPYRQVHDFVETLAQLRTLRGTVISLRDLKYVDLDEVQKLESTLVDQTESRSHQCVQFLLRPDSLQPYATQIDSEQAAIADLKTATAGHQRVTALGEVANQLEMLIEIVSNLQIDDATHRTQIIDDISTIYASLNQTRAALKKRIKALLSVEGAAEFHSQLKLLGQAVVNYLDVCDTPQKCDEYLTRMMVQLEELEGRFSDFDEFVVQLAEKREEVYAAFDNRKLQITEARNRRATALMNSAERILIGIQARLGSLESIDAINSYFASDLMIEKVRNLVEQLTELDESVKVDDIQSRLKTVREDAVRQLRDRAELFVDGQNVIQFGDYRFSVNVQSLDLTTVLKQGEIWFHLSGTNYFERIEDPEFNATQPVWDQTLVSENRDVYRGEYLAYLLFQEVVHQRWQPDLEHPQAVLEFIQSFMAPRYTEGYVKGIHDHDAQQIVEQLLQRAAYLDLLLHSASARVHALMFWAELAPPQRSAWSAQFQSLGNAWQLFGNLAGRQPYINRLAGEIQSFLKEVAGGEPDQAEPVAAALFDQWVQNGGFVASASAVQLNADLDRFLRQQETKAASLIKSKSLSPRELYRVGRDWLTEFAAHRKLNVTPEVINEAAALQAVTLKPKPRVIDASPVCLIENLLGDHPRIEGRSSEINFNHFFDRLQAFQTRTVPAFNRYVQLKKERLAERREALRLDEFKPRVLTSFVRNRLINDVYLPLVGANLAKQIGVSGENKRTDLMGLLLLISPPGYGKTTLMEYIANRLGITFVKINGPAVGHRVHSLDPAEAPNASAREEIEKLNLALEMGDNVMIYLDDIQHCHPEFLQKFISLCDATRKIEGVFQGRTRTYDLRGRKVCVVMAGNPYTESGEKFQIPDMLSNRADTYNLGDVIGDSRDVFELSYLENCLTSNPTLAKLQTGSRADIETIVAMAEQPDQPPGSLEGNYATEQVQEFVSVMKKLLTVRDVVLRVNREYIDSAAQADDFRTEPAFKLQGSYRDMNKIAERIAAIMNDDELEQLILSHYQNQAQTLTQGAEANLLKFREITGRLNPAETARWDEIRQTFHRNQVLGNVQDDDSIGQVVAQLALFADGLRAIQQSLEQGFRPAGDATDESESMQVMTLREMSRVVGELSRFNETLDGIRSSYDEHADTIASLPRHLSEQKIEVVNKVPNAILNVLRNQFRVLQTWMEPILKLAEILPEGSAFVDAARSTQTNYERLMDKMEAEASDSDADDE